MSELKRAWVLFKLHLPYLYKNRILGVLVIYCGLFTFITHWDEDVQMVRLASFIIGELGEERMYALQDSFYDYVFVAYVPLIIFYVRPFVLNVVTESYTVSNSLWLRLSPSTSTTLAIYRSFIILGAAIVLGVVLLVWTIVFSIWHNVQVVLLFQSIYSMIGYTIFTGGLVIIFTGKPTQSIEFRHAYVWLVIIIPIILFFFRNQGHEKFGMLYPFAAPYLKHLIGDITLSGTTAAIIFGVTLLIVKIFLTLAMPSKP